jgi:hypothetical protein|tara:strand:+ start:741 stop:1028 length:288 start_codon:yes stop_codon:yes gene_type:complete
MARGKKYSQLELQAKHTIACAKEEFGTKIQGYLINWSIATDDGGKFIQGFIEDSQAADELRTKMPMKFMGFRTIVSFVTLVEEAQALKTFQYKDY